MAHRETVDVLLVSLGSTQGLRAADAELAESLRRAGASVAVAAAVRPRPVRTFPLTDLSWAMAARRAARLELARQTPRAVIYSSTTAALLWPHPGAIRFDAAAAANRPGRDGLWQRSLERRRLREASLLLPWSEGGLREAPASARSEDRVLVLPVPVESSAPAGMPVETECLRGAAAQGEATPDGGATPRRDIAAITYAANPSKKGLDRVLSAWRRARQPSEELVVAGVSAEDLQGGGALSLDQPGVRVTGPLPPGEYRALLRRARVFVCAPRREDYGISQLEALADGCLLVTTAAPGPYAALPIARMLDPRLIGEDLGIALRTALDEPPPGYAARARVALAPFRREAVDRIVADQLAPRLLAY